MLAIRRIFETLDRAALRAALFAFAMLAGTVLASCKEPASNLDETLTITTKSGVHRISIEVARTEAEKGRGLMFRKSVPSGTGMLFPYSEPQEITMWMKNTYVSLDMVFIRQDGTVHRIARNTEPLSEAVVASRGKVTAVLEIAAGEADRLGIAPGDKVSHPAFSPSR
ncbi:MAG: hypothetical protein RLZ98_1699 [Pseudomonadota bacterium]|jgi:uncharacterized membrane protein (UPF0127 family)